MGFFTTVAKRSEKRQERDRPYSIFVFPWQTEFLFCSGLWHDFTVTKLISEELSCENVSLKGSLTRFRGMFLVPLDSSDITTPDGTGLFLNFFKA
jgi:hypothetical protein